jgi:hypothetical protein
MTLPLLAALTISVHPKWQWLGHVSAKQTFAVTIRIGNAILSTGRMRLDFCAVTVASLSIRW